MMILQFTSMVQRPAINGAPPEVTAGGPIFVVITTISAIVPQGEHALLILIGGVQLPVWEAGDAILKALHSMAARSQLALPPGVRFE